MRSSILISTLLVVATGLCAQDDPKHPYDLSIAAKRASVFPQQAVDLTITVKNDGETPGPNLTRASLLAVKNLVCASPPAGGGAGSAKWKAEFAVATSDAVPAGGILLHPGETFTLQMSVRIPDSVAEGARVVYMEWKGRDGPMKDFRSNQVVLTLQDGKRPIATVETSEGTIVLELWPEKAPNHVANFITLANERKFYDKRIFHRVIRGFMVQTGCPEGTGTGSPGYTIPDEFNDTSFRKGILGMAKTGAPNSAGCQFFVMVADKTHLDGKYTAFGRVLEGQDVADKISNVRAQQDRPLQDVKLKKVRVALPKGYVNPKIKKS